MAYVIEDVHLAHVHFSHVFSIGPTADEVVILRRVTLDSPTNGILLGDSCTGRCEIRIEDSTLTGHGNGTGIFGRYRAPSSQATLSLRNVTISGFTEAIEFWMNTNGDQSVENTLVMENVRIDCETTGLAVMVRDARIRDLEIKGCRDVAAMVEVHGEAEVQDSRFSESETGLLVHAYGRAELRDSEFSDNRGIGINGQENGRMEMTGVKVLRNGYLGIGTWPDGFVHDSVIEGNGFGLDAAGGFPYDATNNYWGDPNGPSVCSAGPDLKPPVGGDCTTHLVTFYPFRSSPP